ncbi:MAG: hypothetical protein O2845_00140 [Proteobacteria bacterium]|nr:hypothetical protein [Pseudomonadota bacterium]
MSPPAWKRPLRWWRSKLENLTYTLVQLAHNFGAVTAVGTAAAALWFVHAEVAQLRLARWMSIAWAVQALSGAGFGATSYYYYEKFPDIKGIAIAALVVKVVCALTGFMLAYSYPKTAPRWTPARRDRAWRVMFSLSAAALTAAAFLRWFS